MFALGEASTFFVENDNRIFAKPSPVSPTSRHFNQPQGLQRTGSPLHARLSTTPLHHGALSGALAPQESE